MHPCEFHIAYKKPFSLGPRSGLGGTDRTCTISSSSHACLEYAAFST
jgi:hypothetical protein